MFFLKYIGVMRNSCQQVLHLCNHGEVRVRTGVCYYSQHPAYICLKTTDELFRVILMTYLYLTLVVLVIWG